MLLILISPIVSVLAQKYGKRPQFLIASFFGVIGTGVCIAGFDQTSLSKSYHVLLSGRMIQGIGATAYESLSVAAIGDMFYLHERGLRTALLVLTLACLSSFVGIISGTGFEHLGARNLFVMLLPIQIFGMLGAVFFIPESQFRRDAAPLSTVTASTDIVKNKEVQTASEIAKLDSSVMPKRTFVQGMRVTSGTYNNDNAFKLISKIFLHLLNPAVIWTQITSAVLVVRITSSPLPYHKMLLTQTLSPSS
jgi:MFS family permease